MDCEQLSIFDMAPEQEDAFKTGQLNVVYANFSEMKKQNWQELFEGYDELYGITFSSGIQFVEKVADRFEHVEIIYGCEGVIGSDIATIISLQTKSVELIAKSKSAKIIAERIDANTMSIYVSRDTKSHEKIFILKAKDGRTRVITGSANLSASAFCGLQRENILCFDDPNAYDYYKDCFDNFKELCSDNVSQKVISAIVDDEDYLRENIEEVPIIKTVEAKNIVVIEPGEVTTEDEVIAADLKGLESEIKPMIQKSKKRDEKIVLTGDITKGIARKCREYAEVKKVKEKKLPKLHLDYEGASLSFNGKNLELNPSKQLVESDIQCFENYMSSLSSFHGDWKKSQRYYFAFMNWYFSSLFMPYLRYVANKNNYDMTPFPVFGIIYGDSNGGKSTFIKLLSKMMCGVKIPLNSSGDFVASNIENLKRACEGLPINIDDLAKLQYDNHYEKIIKDDTWGLEDGFINYPAVAITTNKLASLKSDISKRTVTCYIGTKLNKEDGARNSKRINESMKQVTCSFYCEYVRRMLTRISAMIEDMKGDGDYFPDVFFESSSTIKEIFEEYSGGVPDYVSVLTYSDYFGDTAIGKNAMDKIVRAWESDRKMFNVNKKKNTLTYTIMERSYELVHIQQELPPMLDAQVVGNKLVMNLEKAKELFGIKFNKSFFEK